MRGKRATPMGLCGSWVNTLVQAPCWPHPLRQILWQVDRILQMQVEVSSWMSMIKNFLCYFSTAPFGFFYSHGWMKERRAWQYCQPFCKNTPFALGGKDREILSSRTQVTNEPTMDGILVVDRIQLSWRWVLLWSVYYGLGNWQECIGYCEYSQHTRLFTKTSLVINYHLFW